MLMLLGTVTRFRVRFGMKTVREGGIREWVVGGMIWSRFVVLYTRRIIANNAQ